MPVGTEVPLVSCCCVHCIEHLFLLTFLHTITVLTRKAPLRKTKTREATIAARILPENVVDMWSSGDGMGDVGPHDSEADGFIPSDNVSTGSAINISTYLY